MTKTIEEFCANHELVRTALFNAEQYTDRIERLEMEIEALKATIKTERIQSRIQGRGPGRPANTAADLRLAAAKAELEQAREGLVTEQEALPAIKAHVQSLFPTQQRVGELAAAIAEKAAAFRHLLEGALAVHGEALDMQDELDHIPRQHGLTFYRTATVGPRVGQRVGNVHVPCLRDQIEEFLGPAPSNAPVVQVVSGPDSTWDDSCAKSAAIAQTVKDVIEVQQARQFLDQAVRKLDKTAILTEDGQQANPDRLAAHQGAMAAEVAYWDAVAVAARVERTALAAKSEVPSLWGEN